MKATTIVLTALNVDRGLSREMIKVKIAPCDPNGIRNVMVRSMTRVAAITIRATMAAYENNQWRWMDNIERSRMLLCLSWMIRLQDTAEHRHWLALVADDLLKDQDASGAIQERRGGAENTGFQIAKSNEEYGTGETPPRPAAHSRRV